MLFIYINDLSENLASIPKLFADGTSLFSVVKNVDVTNIDLNNDLKKIGEWAFQQKINFNPDPTKQAQELIFFRKVQTTNHPPLFFNENVVLQTTLQKHLRMFLDSKLNFSQHLKTIFQKTDKTIGPLCELQTLLPKAILITIYKLFIRPHLNFGDISSNIQYVVSTKNGFHSV